VERCEEIRRVVFDLVNFKEPDKNSAYYQIFKMGRYTHDVLVDDILSCLHIGFITLCPTFLAAIKNLRENKDISDKLKRIVRSSLENELEKHRDDLKQKSKSTKHKNKVESTPQTEDDTKGGLKDEHENKEKEDSKENSELTILEVLIH
jgi:hypothetical protein